MCEEEMGQGEAVVEEELPGRDLQRRVRVKEAQLDRPVQPDGGKEPLACERHRECLWEDLERARLGALDEQRDAACQHGLEGVRRHGRSALAARFPCGGKVHLPRVGTSPGGG